MKLFIILVLAGLSFGAKKTDLYFKGDFGKDYTIDLAHPEKGKVKLPPGAANIRDIVEVNGTIVGITHPENKKYPPHVFRFSLEKDELIDYIALTNGYLAAHRLAVGPDGTVYGGIYKTDTAGYTGSFKPQSDGALLKIDASGKKLKITQLEIPSGYGVYTLTVSSARKQLYGLLYPTNLFFRFDLKKETSEVYTESLLDSNTQKRIKAMHIDDESHLCRALGMDKKGRVYGSTGLGYLFRYEPKKNKVTKLDLQLPYIQNHQATNCVESWVLGPDKHLYGGTSVDGFLFRLNTKKVTITNLGKPIIHGNLKSLICIGKKLFGLAGGQPAYTHLFTYDLKTGGFEDLGLPRVTSRLIDSKTLTHTMSRILRLKDGRMVMAEDDLMPSLIFIKSP